jgi:hypothetical protein
MPQFTTFYVGMDVHKESIAVAYVAQDGGEEHEWEGQVRYLLL